MFIGKLPHGLPGAVVSRLYISELAPDFDVVGILFQMLCKDGVGITADCCATVAEDSGNALKLVPQVAFDVQGMAVCQLGRSKECSLELGEVRLALLFADTLLLGWLSCGCYGCCLCLYLLVVKTDFRRWQVWCCQTRYRC